MILIVCAYFYACLCACVCVCVGARECYGFAGNVSVQILAPTSRRLPVMVSFRFIDLFNSHGLFYSFLNA